MAGAQGSEVQVGKVDSDSECGESLDWGGRCELDHNGLGATLWS